MHASGTVFVVDDDESILESLRFLLESDGLRVETYLSAAQFLTAYEPRRPSCLLSDIRMPGMSGLELQALLKEKNVPLPVVFVTGHGDIPMAVQAMKMGALNFLVKPFREQLLLETLHEALDLDMQQQQVDLEYEKIQECYCKLTPRERDVMKLIVQGKLNKVIAYELGIGIKTVEIHRARIMQKMGAPSLAVLVRMVMRLESLPQEVV